MESDDTSVAVRRACCQVISSPSCASSETSTVGSVITWSSISKHFSSQTDPRATRGVPDHALHLVTADLRVGPGGGWA